MRCFKASIVLVWFVLFTEISWAASSCGTVMPARRKFQWGLALNSLQEYEMDNATTKTEVRSNQAFLTLGYGIFDWFTLDGKIGIGDIRNDRTASFNLDYDAGWGGGYGFRVKAYENRAKGIKIIAGVHHISVHPSSEEVDSVKYKSILDDNQIDAIISKEFSFGIPYIGCKVSRSRLMRRDKTNSSSMHSDIKAGLILGYDLETSKDTFLNIEARFIDETGYTLGISHIF
jgi:hypothetical protein